MPTVSTYSHVHNFTRMHMTDSQDVIPSIYSYSPTRRFPTFPSDSPTILTPLGPWGEQQARRIELLTEASCSRRLSTSRWAASARWGWGGGELGQAQLRGEQGHSGSHHGPLPSLRMPQAGLGLCLQLPCHLAWNGAWMEGPQRWLP